MTRASEVLLKAVEIAHADPEFVYRTGGEGECRYVEYDGTPGCLFGQALLACGVTPEQIARLEGNPIQTMLARLTDEDVEPSIAEAAGRSQDRQDGGLLRRAPSPWGEAIVPLEEALREVGLLG